MKKLIYLLFAAMACGGTARGAEILLPTVTSGSTPVFLPTVAESKCAGCNGACGAACPCGTCVGQCVAKPVVQVQKAQPIRVTVPNRTGAPMDHTHTCPRCGYVWDHSMDGGSHLCPNCHAFQNVQDSQRRVTTATYQGRQVITAPMFSGFTSSGGCSSGSCSSGGTSLFRGIMSSGGCSSGSCSSGVSSFGGFTSSGGCASGNCSTSRGR